MEFRHGTGRVHCVIETPGESKQHILRPEDVDTSGGQVGRFGKCEVEIVAANLVRFFQLRGGWVTFSLPELIFFYKLQGLDPRQALFGLLGPWYDDGGLGTIREGIPYLVALPNGNYCVTGLFIEQCKSSIKKKK